MDMDESPTKPTYHLCCFVRTKFTWPFLDLNLHVKRERYNIFYHDRPLQTFQNFDKSYKKARQNVIFIYNIGISVSIYLI